MKLQDKDTAPIEVRFALRVATVGYMLAFGLAIIFAPIGYFIFKSPEFTIISIGFAVSYLLCYMVASAGYGVFTRVAFCALASLHYAVVLQWVGPSAGLQAYIGCMVATPLVIYARTEPKLSIASLLTLVVAIVAGEYLSRAGDPFLDLDASALSMAYLSNMGAASLFIAFLILMYSRSSITNYINLHSERQKSQEMLYELMPSAIADQMMRGEPIVAQSQGECSVLFADIVGFTRLANELSPVHLVEVLNGLFSSIDQICDEHRIEKIKTIGDCYMAATGVFAGQNRPAELAIVALSIVDVVQEWAAKTGHPLQVRIGISTGQVISGVIGRKRPLFDIWGQTVNIAKLMEANSLGNTILVSEATVWRLKSDFDFEPFHTVTTKSGSAMKAFRLVAARR